MIQLLSGIQNTCSALEAERVRMEVIGQNIAHANTTRSSDGRPYQRQQVVFESVLNQAGVATGPQGVHVARVTADAREPRKVYDPGHPDADPQGLVTVPNINIHEEMADLISASRAFEANLAVVRNSRQMALQALNIGKR